MELRLNSSSTTPMVGEIAHDTESGQVLIWDSHTWVPIAHEGGLTKEDILEEFEKNPELYNEVMVEMRNRKINKFK